MLRQEAREAWKSTMDTVRDAYAILTKDPDEYEKEHEDEEEYEDLDDLQDRTRQDNDPAGIETIQCVHITLAGGGPGEWIRLFFRDGSDEPFEGEWWYTDGGPAEYIALESDECAMIMEVYGVAAPESQRKERRW